MQVLIAISGFCPRIGNVPCTTPFDFLFVISIHVPTWGTTLSISTNLFALIFQSTFPRGERPGITMTFTRALPFQSTFPRGERRGPYLIFLSPCRFQSTFPRGERHLCWLVAVKHIHFNPRSLVGNDYIPVGTYTIVEISIHVPSWGTTIFTRRQPPCILFQSTFPRGERRSS